MILAALGWMACVGQESGAPLSTPTEPTLPVAPAPTPPTPPTPSTSPTGGATGDTGSVPDPHGLSWALHPEVGSFVVVSWDQAVAGEAYVTWSVDEGVWRTTPSVQGEVGNNELLLVGLPYGATAAWQVITPEGTWSAAEPLVTAPVPEGLPRATVEVDVPEAQHADGAYLLTSINQERGGWTAGTYWTVLLDRQGRYVWARRTAASDWTLYPTVARGGDHLLIDEATAWSSFDHGAGSRVVHAWLDAEGEAVPLPGLHHAFIEHDDGTLAWGSVLQGEGEQLVELAPDATAPVTVWDCFEDFPGVADNVAPRCESNSLWYDAERGTYLYSFYTNDSVVELDRATGTTLWWAGGQPGGLAFDPPESQFEWQHGIGWTDAGTLLLSSRAREPSLTTKVFEYTVDREAGILTEVWSYDAGVHASTNGDVHRYADGTTLHAVGSAGQVHEIASDGQPVWVLDFGGTHLIGRAQWVADLHSLLSPRP